MKSKIVVVLTLIILLVGCTSPKPVTDDTGVTNEDIESVVRANNNFAFDFYRAINKPEENLFFSPYSLSTALAMTYEGAKEQTAQEMQAVFHYPSIDQLRKGSASVYNKLNSKDKEVKLNTANALWAQENFKFLDEYFTNIEKYYGGKVTNLDFAQDTKASRIIINDWVEAQTMNKIKNIIPPGVLNQATRLVLTNAIYFKGNWVKEFDKKDTREQDFWQTKDSSIKSEMMRLKDEEFNFAETKDVKILELPYDGNKYSMLLLLPKGKTEKEDYERNYGLEQAEKYLTKEDLLELKTQMTKQELLVMIPKFKFETKYFLKETLSSMGMPTAFSDVADFSGMTGSKDLMITSVIHQAFIEVDEKGTEAAAATVVAVGLTSAGPSGPVFVADHPFIFMIQEIETGNILFLGKVYDPTK
ncbi:serpin family protein [archaeon]|jgi:serpin B|nr:serpin family protein [archaeon]MBT4273045.1 serpin family protein [archaeon]MBT4461026.1 serpin family protein [archaeon]MBT4858080.1 serpin family protein [archaeon]MBT5423738.1 serpin family protein [archaeon]